MVKKTSEWIKILQKLVDDYGDLPFMLNSEGDFYLAPIYADADVSEEGNRYITIICEITGEE